MEKFLNIVEEPSSAASEINEDRLKFFNSKVKIWECACISLGDY